MILKNTFKILNKDDFCSVYKLMELSFPVEEFRTYEEAFPLLSLSEYQILTIEEDRVIKAFIAQWSFQDFYYIEHFAVNPSARGEGLGTQIIRDYLDQAKLPVVIEVETANTINAKRRITFYERLGFILSEIEYMQPPLQPASHGVLLRLMHYPADISKELLLKMKQDIFQTIYSKI